MFDINNRDFIKKIIDMRDEKEYVIPLYVKIYNETYPILELDSISDFSPSSFKVGFGSSSSRFNNNSFITEYAMEFETVSVFGMFDENIGENILYNIFESSDVSDDSEMHIQINKYVNILRNYVSEKVSIKKKKMLEELMNEDS